MSKIVFSFSLYGNLLAKRIDNNGITYYKDSRRILELILSYKMKNVVVNNNSLICNCDNVLVTIDNIGMLRKYINTQKIDSGSNKRVIFYDKKASDIRVKINKALSVAGLATLFTGAMLLTNVVWENIKGSSDIDDSFDPKRYEYVSEIDNSNHNKLSNGDEIVMEEDPIIMINSSFDERANDEKRELLDSEYHDHILKCSRVTGIDSNLILAVACAADDDYTNTINANGNIGIMDVNYYAWVNKTIKFYNYEEKTYQFLEITEDRLKDNEWNIFIKSALMQRDLNDSNYNLTMALEMFNIGYHKTLEKIDKFGSDSGIYPYKVVNDPTKTTWLSYFDDGAYSSKVYSYMPKDSVITIKRMIVEEEVDYLYKVNNLQNHKQIKNT